MEEVIYIKLVYEGFYINYEVCKELDCNKYSNSSNSFILTMRYVKYEISPELLIGRKEFYINYEVCKDDVFITVEKKAKEFYINYEVCKDVKRLMLQKVNVTVLY